MIGVPPASALSRLGLRLSERKARQGSGTSGLTQEDEANLEEFETIVSNMIEFLRKEQDALAANDIGRVASYFEEKVKLLEAIERRQPVVEPFLTADVPVAVQLRNLIKELSEQIATNERLLRGMAEASRTIVNEIEHLRNRQSLKGVYDKSGQLRGDVSVQPAAKGFEKKY